jgi:hypothetical protein
VTLICLLNVMIVIAESRSEQDIIVLILDLKLKQDIGLVFSGELDQRLIINGKDK